MKRPAIPENEIERLELLKSFEILDTEVEEIFDNFTKLTASICDVPICLISLIDENRQWFKSKYGLNANETPRDVSFCGHAINSTDLLYIEDATKDERFKDNPLVTGNPNVIFYAGAPLTSVNGLSIGTLCVIDNKPRKLSPMQIEQLKLISKQVMYMIESRIEIKLKDQSYYLLNKLAENLPGFIYTYELRPNGKATFPYSSQFIEQIYEVTPAQAKIDGSIVLDRIHPEDLENVLKAIKISAIEMSIWKCDYRVILPSHGEKWVRGIANPRRAIDGSILWHGYICEITELKNQEVYLNQASKMAVLGEMAAGIAHEINNPLAIIKTSAQHIRSLIERKELSEEKLIKYFDKISATTDRIAKIIKGLKSFSRDSADNPFATESLHTIIEDSVSLCVEKFKSNNITFTFPDKLESLEIECRAVEISQVLLNLLNNSFDAVASLEKKWVHIAIQDLPSEVILSVQDSGSGLTAEMATKILQPFFTTKAAGVGTGLGLSISKKIIESHQGEFWIDLNSKNTKFCFKLPKRQFKTV